MMFQISEVLSSMGFEPILKKYTPKSKNRVDIYKIVLKGNEATRFLIYTHPQNSKRWGCRDLNFRSIAVTDFQTPSLE